MTTYTLKLSPMYPHPGSDGSVDETIVNGVSVQRSGFIEVASGDNRKIVAVDDGDTFTNTMQTITSFDFIVAVSED